jgi:hypothetical protein
MSFSPGEVSDLSSDLKRSKPTLRRRWLVFQVQIDDVRCSLFPRLSLSSFVLLKSDGRGSPPRRMTFRGRWRG